MFVTKLQIAKPLSQLTKQIWGILQTATARLSAGGNCVSVSRAGKTGMEDANTPPAPTRMNTWKWLLVLGLLAVSLFHRWHGIANFPLPNQTADEYHYLWGGISLWETGRPLSWSWLDSYDQYDAVLAEIQYSGNDYRIVSPALDHPPLFHVLLGGFAHLSGTKGIRTPLTPDGTHAIWKVNLAQARWFALLLYALTFIVLFDLARQLFPFSTTLLTLLLYGFIGYIVVHGRLLVTENLSTLLFLLNISILQRYLDGRCSKQVFAGVTILTVAAALLTKMLAASQAVAVLGLLLIHEKRREILYPIVGVIIGLVLYLLYGWVQGWSIFWGVINEQSQRFQGFASIAHIIYTPKIVHTYSPSYLLMVGWITLFIQTVGRQGPKILWAPLFYLLGVFFFTSFDSIYGWHTIFIYPFLCLSLAAFVSGVYRQASLLGFFALLILLFPDAFHFLIYLVSRNLQIFRYAYLVALGTLVSVTFFANLKIRTLAIRLTVILILFLVTLNEFCWIWYKSSARFVGRHKVSLLQEPKGVPLNLGAWEDLKPQELKAGLLVRQGKPPFWRQNQEANHDLKPNLNFEYSVTEKPFKGPFWLWYRGYLKIPADGIYVFATNSDDGSDLWLDGIKIVDNWGDHGPILVSNAVRLKAGYHLFELRYYDVAVDAVLEVLVQRPGDDIAIPLPEKWLFCHPMETQLSWQAK